MTSQRSDRTPPTTAPSPASTAAPAPPAASTPAPASPAQHEAWSTRRHPPVEQVRDGVWSLPIVFPENPMRFTYCYALFGDDDLVLVDPGWESDAGWDQLVAGLRAAGSSIDEVNGVVITHLHPDHHGLSRRVADASGAWIAMHAADHAAMRVYASYWSGESDHVASRRHALNVSGFPATAVDPVTAADPDEHGPQLAEPDRYLADGDLVALCGRRIEVIETPGHTPGHLCLYDHDRDLALTGDHILPKVSPNVGASLPGEQSPLTRYLGSLERLRRYDSAEVLPAHEYRFHRLAQRIDALAAHHAERGDEIWALLADGSGLTAWETAAQVPWSRGWETLSPMMRLAALGETIAHLDHLVEQARATRTPDSADSEAPLRYRATTRAV